MEAEQLICDAEKVKERLATARECAPASACDLLEKMLSQDAAGRITITQALVHPYILDSFKLAPRGHGTFDAGILPKLRRYIAAPPLEQLALIIAAHLLCPDDDQRLLAEYLAFRVADEDGDGNVTQAELMAALRSNGIDVPTDFESIFCGIDTNKDGVINFIEFMAATMHPSVYQRESICKAIFRELDADDDKLISAADMEVLLGLGSNCADIRAAVMNQLQGGIGFQDFLVMMHRSD